MIAALLGAGEKEMLTQRVEQRRCVSTSRSRTIPFTLNETSAMEGLLTTANSCASSLDGAPSATTAAVPINRFRRDISKSLIFCMDHSSGYEGVTD